MSGVNSLAVLDQGRPPSIFQARGSSLNQAAQANIALGFAVVTYRGKIWRLVYQGEEEIVRDPMRPDEPAGSIEAVIIGAASAVSKQYYARPYTDGSDQAPDCYSLDGVKPEAGAPQKQNALCATCAQNQWGSRVTDDGRRAKRCADAKRIAIVPAGDIENDAFGGPMLLRIPPTSLPALSLYAGNLARRGAPLEALVTKIGFNHELAYPQLTFTPQRWLTDEEARLVVGPDGRGGMQQHPVVARILVDSVAMAAPGGGEAEPEPAEQQPAAPSPPPPPPPASPEPAPEAAAAAAAASEAEAAKKVTPMRRPAFGGAGPATQVKQAASEAPPPNGAAGQVSTAPPGMNAAIDRLLATPVAE